MTNRPRRHSRVEKKSPLPLIMVGIAALIIIGTVAYMLISNNQDSADTIITSAATTEAVTTDSITNTDNTTANTVGMTNIQRNTVLTFEDEGNEHVNDGTNVNYRTNPPTSGSHWVGPAPWSIYATTAPDDERLVHNMEHGGVIMWYDPARLSESDQKAVKDLYKEFIQIDRRVILTIRSEMDAPLMITAWNKMLALDTFDKGQIQKFFDAYILQGPECVDGRCPG